MFAAEDGGRPARGRQAPIRAPDPQPRRRTFCGTTSRSKGAPERGGGGAAVQRKIDPSFKSAARDYVERQVDNFSHTPKVMGALEDDDETYSAVDDKFKGRVATLLAGFQQKSRVMKSKVVKLPLVDPYAKKKIHNQDKKKIVQNAATAQFVFKGSAFKHINDHDSFYRGKGAGAALQRDVESFIQQSTPSEIDDGSYSDGSVFTIKNFNGSKWSVAFSTVDQGKNITVFHVGPGG